MNRVFTILVSLFCLKVNGGGAADDEAETAQTSPKRKQIVFSNNVSS